jgi:hypothetical protein
MILNYVFPGNPRHLVVMEKPFDYEDPSQVNWLHAMVEEHVSINFFFTVESTDIWEKEWDYNEVAQIPICVCPGAPYHKDFCPQSKNYNQDSVIINIAGHPQTFILGDKL